MDFVPERSNSLDSRGGVFAIPCLWSRGEIVGSRGFANQVQYFRQLRCC